jgi:SAM-dependent methyltransferase
MKIAKNCPICSSEKLSFFATCPEEKELFALVDMPPLKSTWSHCNKCNHVFLNPKFSKQIEDKLYGIESLYRKHSMGAKSLEEYLSTIDNTVKDRTAVHPAHLHNLNKIIKLTGLNKGSKILDFGAGFGSASSAVLFKEMDYYGYEFDEFCLKIAKSLERNVQSTVEPNDLFDLVYSCQVFEHISDPIPALMSMIDLAADGAYIYINVPTHKFTFFPPRNLANGGVLAMNWGHFHSYTQQSLTYMLEGTDKVEVFDAWLENNDIHILAKKNLNVKRKKYKHKKVSLIIEKIQYNFAKYINGGIYYLIVRVKQIIKKII